jgi:hypothetical protein
MVAELPHVRGRHQRWQFATGMLFVALVLQFPSRRWMVLATCGGVIVTAAGTALAATRVPGMSVFTAVLGLLLTACLTLAARRPLREHLAAPRLIAGAAAMGGAVAAVTTVARVAVAHPLAAADPTYAYSVLFAVALTCCLTLAQAVVGPGGHPATVLWCGAGGTLAATAYLIVMDFVVPVNPDGTDFFWLAGASVTLAAAAAAAAASRSRRVGIRAGVLTMILSSLSHLTIYLTALLSVRHYTLTNAYDIAAYPHSGYPDIASYLLSDAVGGSILALVLYPVSWLLLAVLGAAAGSSLRHHAHRHTATSS